MDAIERASSGHPGMVMGTADLAAVLWSKFLKHNPNDPNWANRDRFVLSAGHGSMLLYALLHLSGYDMSIDDLKNFRQWGSKTPGHPELGPGVETTTGPLGQGCGNAVGMAIAERMLAARFNTREDIVDHFTYVLASDGEMMEGGSHEAFALAGHLGLGKLIVFYDANEITIEGKTNLAYSEDVRRRFEGYHWHVQDLDGHDHAAIEEAIESAQSNLEQPTLLITHTEIGKGSPNKGGTEESHGAPLGEEEIKLSKEQLGLPADQKFYVPDPVYETFAARRKELSALADKWADNFSTWRNNNGSLATLWDTYLKSDLPDNLGKDLPEFEAGTMMATRSASGAVMQAIAAKIPNFIGGSADLGPSNKTYLKGKGHVAKGDFQGRNFHFGVRELGMAAIMSGISIHGGFRIFGATFAIFSDFARPAMRLAALMKQPVTYVFSHDSFHVGEDGPTHQPIETICAMRTIPNLTVIRPADSNETTYAWLVALRRKSGPTSLLTTRQKVATIDREECASAFNLERGAYVLWENADENHDLILIASGSEVMLTLQAAQKLAAEGKRIRVVSFPSWELFEEQSKTYRESVFPPATKNRLAVEAGISLGWEKYTGERGRIISIDHFGSSAPESVLAEKFGFTVDSVYEEAQKMI